MRRRLADLEAHLGQGPQISRSIARSLHKYSLPICAQSRSVLDIRFRGLLRLSSYGVLRMRRTNQAKEKVAIPTVDLVE